MCMYYVDIFLSLPLFFSLPLSLSLCLQVYRVKAKWKFQLKDGIMRMKGCEYVFHKASGEAEW